MLNALRRRFNRLTGFDVVRWSAMHTVSAALCAAIAKFSIDCVVDVGANRGQFGKKLRDLGFSGKIISFEPVSLTYQELKELAGNDRNWELNNCALGSEPGHAEINVSEETVFSSFYDTTEFAKQTWLHSRTVATERVEIRTLDALVLEGKFGDCERILLKLDTQGFDLQVLSGGKRLLPKTRLIFIEMSFRKVYEQSPLFEESLGFLAALGYFPSAIYPVTRSRDFTLNEVDVLFARRSLVAIRPWLNRPPPGVQ